MCKHITSHTMSDTMSDTMSHTTNLITYLNNDINPMPNPSIKIIKDTNKPTVSYIITQTTDPKWSAKIRRIIQRET